MIACNTPALQEWWDGKKHHKARKRYFFLCFCRLKPALPPIGSFTVSRIGPL
jgi:hypothetical protein